ncbi:MAG: STAS domain-containing protein [Carboxydocellales bacterium]
MLNIETCTENNVGYLKITGELDISTIELFRTNMENVHNDVSQVVLDFNDVQFVDSTGVGGLVQEIERLEGNGVCVRVQNIPQEVFEVLDLLGIPDLLGDVSFVQKAE